MIFIFKMAWRDSRASRRRLTLFSLSIVLGIAALVAIGSVAANLARAIDTQAKGLLGADLIVTARAPLGEATKAYLDGLGGEQASDVSFSSMLVFPTSGNATRLVQVRGMQGAFPFFGDFLTEPVSATETLRAAQLGAAGERVVILEETLLRQFGVNVGDPVKLGNATFTIVGALRKLPGEGPAVAATFAPRALIPMRALEATGLSGRATLVRYRTLLLLPGRDPEAIVREMRARFPLERLSFDTVEERKRDLGRAFQNIQGFLSLVGFIALFLGAIGVASAIGVYVRQKIPTVAMLRCLGASARQSFSVYLTQGIALGVMGALVGAAVGVGVQFILPRLVAGLLPFDVEVFVAWPAVARGAAAGLAICVLFTLLPLLAIRRVSPLAALRSSVGEKDARGADPWRVAVGVLIAAAVAGFAIWQTGSVRLGLGFAGMLAVGLGVLAGMAKLVAWLARRASRSAAARRMPYVVRQGVANLYRPQNRTVLLLFALGLGAFLMLTLYLTRSTLLREIEGAGGSGRPNLLFFDIQDDQLDPLLKLAADQGVPAQVTAPVVTMRIRSINGRLAEQLLTDQGEPAEPADEANASGRAARAGVDAEKEERIPAWTLRREYRSTFRSELRGSERLAQGKLVPRVEPGAEVTPISIEEGLLRQMHLKLGDEIEWDVQGVPLRSRIASVRTVEWRRLEPNFFIVFPAGVLEPAPKFHIAAFRAADAEQSGRLQRAIVSAFPSVTAIDLALVMQTLDGIFSKVAFVIQFIALFTVATGVIVLTGAVLTGRYQRIRETVLLRTLGATRRQLTQILLVEYAALGLLAAVTGGALAVAANLLLAQYVFKIRAFAPPWELAAAVVAVVAVTLVTGLWANRSVTSHPPLETLRQET